MSSSSCIQPLTRAQVAAFRASTSFSSFQRPTMTTHLRSTLCFVSFWSCTAKKQGRTINLSRANLQSRMIHRDRGSSRTRAFAFASARAFAART